MRNKVRTQLLMTITASALLGTASWGQHIAPPPGGFTVDDVVSQFITLAHHPDPISVNQGVGQDATLCKHYQGVVRHYGLDGTPYLIISRSGQRASCAFCGFDCSDDPAEIVFAKLSSRPKHGERMRSNILDKNSSFKDTAPPLSDTIETSMVFNGQNGLTAWMHAGGMQLVDDVLVIPMERSWPSDSNTGSLVLIDVFDPQNPTVINEFFLPYKAGVFAMTKDPVTGKYIFAVSGGDTTVVQWYETTSDDLHDPNLQIISLDTWTVNDSDVPANVRDNWEKWQTINFIRQTDGQLFLGTTDNTSFGDDDDGSHLAGMFRVTRSGDNFNMAYVFERKLKLDDPRTGNGAASGGYYVSPSGQLILYTTEHDNKGPSDSIRCGELRSYNVSTASTGYQDPSNDSWIELYNDEKGWDDDSPDKSLMLDKIDYGLENWLDLDDEDGWGDEPDSLRYRMPAGHQILLFEDQNFNGNFLRLAGTGSIRSITKLDDFNFGDKIHSVFMGAYEVPTGTSVFFGTSNIIALTNAWGYSGRLELVTGPGAWIDPNSSTVGWGNPGPGKQVLIRAQPNKTTLILGN
ncbi:MAG: hypothetical protein AB8C13_10845 [Phycisphaerales bacterium]